MASKKKAIKCVPCQWELTGLEEGFWVNIARIFGGTFNAVVGTPTGVINKDLDTLDSAISWAEDQVRRG